MEPPSRRRRAARGAQPLCAAVAILAAAYPAAAADPPWQAAWDRRLELEATTPFHGLAWKSLGPVDRGGRVVDIERLEGAGGSAEAELVVEAPEPRKPRLPAEEPIRGRPWDADEGGDEDEDEEDERGGGGGDRRGA